VSRKNPRRSFPARGSGMRAHGSGGGYWFARPDARRRWSTALREIQGGPPASSRHEPQRRRARRLSLDLQAVNRPVRSRPSGARQQVAHERVAQAGRVLEAVPSRRRTTVTPGMSRWRADQERALLTLGVGRQFQVL